MTPLPDVAAPIGMALDIAELSTRARHDPTCLYGRLLRENVGEVLECSFPGFAGRVGPWILAQMVDRFVAEHRATRPQFHHIATEFVEFAQAQLSLPPPLLCGLEYEWALLAVEIDLVRVGSSRAGGAQAPTDWRVAINPTCRLVVLPFDVTGDAWDHAAHRAHAIYRTADHGVLTQALSRQDCRFIDLVRSTDAITLGALATKAAAWSSPEGAAQWAAISLDFGLLCRVAPNNGDLDEPVPPC
jgi:uncharacterized protein